MSKSNQAFKIITLRKVSWAISFAYPFIVFWGNSVLHPVCFVATAFVIFGVRWRDAVRFLNSIKTDTLQSKKILFSSIFATILLMVSLLLWRPYLAILFYPVLMNLSMTIVFGVSLVYPPPLIERLARLSGHKLDEDGIHYTGLVTKVWLVFCLVNTFISFGTVLMNDLKIWTVYNGFISYTLIGLLIGAEVIVRRLRQKRPKCSRSKKRL